MHQKKGAYRRYRKKYRIRAGACALLALFFVCGIAAFGGFWLGDAKAAALLALEGIFLLGILFAFHKTEDAYISGIVSELSALLEQLAQLQPAEVFPETEDTLLSKLQTQTTRLIRMLRQQNERERKEHENIKALVSDLSHQLKTPLANAKMYTEFLRQEELTNEQRMEYAEILRISVERLLFLSESMIKLSRLESGLIHLECSSQSINETVLTAVKLVYAKAKECGVEIRYEEKFQGMVFHDAAWTAEAVYNLLDNAVKYGRAGSSVTVTVRALGTMAEIAVEDENEPIDESEYSEIFKRFYRGRGSGAAEGVGIGLYLTREIITRQGGYVSVRRGAAGNRFSVVLRKE